MKKFYKIHYISAPIHVTDLKIGVPAQVDVLHPKNVKLSISDNIDFFKNFHKSITAQRPNVLIDTFKVLIDSAHCATHF